MSSFCEQLRARGQQLELSDAAIARRLGISQSRYTNYVNGHREPDFAMLARICLVLNTTPNELLGFDGPGEQKLAEIYTCNGSRQPLRH